MAERNADVANSTDESGGVGRLDLFFQDGVFRADLVLQVLQLRHDRLDGLCEPGMLVWGEGRGTERKRPPRDCVAIRVERVGGDLGGGIVMGWGGLDILEDCDRSLISSAF